VPSILEARGLHAGYGEVRVLKDVSVRVAHGSITAVIGSNGAGKTTLMRTLTGLLSPQQGVITFEDADVTALPAHVRVDKGLTLVPEGRLFSLISPSMRRFALALFRIMRVRIGRHGPIICMSCSPDCGSGGTFGRGHCPAASSRCWHWRAA
jgi:energy-coupling factor transporter ATP-binding protein EcfA2